MKKLISLAIRFIPRKYLQVFSGIGLKALAVFYWGNKVKCAVCEHTYSRFLPYGRINSRPNALCPHCLSLERHRLLWLFLKEKTDFFKKPLQVLHIAPEHCFMKGFERQHGKGYITGDIESPLAKVKMDIHKIPFEANHFDAVMCNHVLEHVESDIKAMAEIHRVLKPGGWAVLQVPFFSPVPDQTVEDNTITDPRMREKLFGQDDHVRKFGKDYASRIKQSGLTPKPDDFAAKFSEEEAFRLGISKGEIIYFAVKA